MASHQSLKAEKSVWLILIYVIKRPFSYTFMDFKHKRLTISRPVEVGKNYIPQKKALLPIVWKKFKTGRIFAMEVSKRVSVEVVFFQLRECGHPQGDVTTNFFPDSKRSILGLSNEVYFVSRFFRKIAENWKKEESIPWLNVSNWEKLYIYHTCTNKGCSFCTKIISVVHNLACFY